MISHSRLKELFDYSPDGGFIRKVVLNRRSKVGEYVYGFSDRLGYKYASVDSKTYPMHRLIWAWHGHEESELDHVNRIRSDNRIENLRPASRCQNMWNKGKQSNNTSGVKGVCWKKDKDAWSVRLGVEGRRLHIGYFKEIELAELVAIEARAKYHGSFANAH